MGNINLSVKKLFNQLFPSHKFLYFLFLLSAEAAAWHARQVPHPVPLCGGRPLLHQRQLSVQLPPVACGKEPNHHRCLSVAAAPPWLWFKTAALADAALCVSSPSEAFRAPVFANGADKSGFSLGFGRNVAEVFGDQPKYWMLPVFSRRVHSKHINRVVIGQWLLHANTLTDSLLAVWVMASLLLPDWFTLILN